MQINPVKIGLFHVVRISAVVLAKARTHNHRRSSLGHAGASIGVTTSSCGYGSRVALALDGASRRKGLACPGRQKAFPRRVLRPGLCWNLVPPNKEGQGMPGAGRTRRACVLKRKNAHKITGKAETSGIPCAMALRLTPRSPWCPGVLATIPPGLLTPGVDPGVGGSGPHGLTVRPRCIRLPHQERPSRPTQRFVTMAKRLISERGMACFRSQLLTFGNRNIFVGRRLTRRAKQAASFGVLPVASWATLTGWVGRARSALATEADSQSASEEVR